MVAMKKVAPVILSIVLLFGSARPQLGGFGSGYDKPLAGFESHREPAIQAILRLGLESKVPIGIIETDEQLCKAKVDVAAQGQTPLQIIAALIAQVSGYSWSVKDGVLSVQPANMPDGPVRLLSIAIPRFAAPEGTLDSQRAILWMQIRGVLEPGEGTAVSVMRSLKAQTFPPIDMSNATVEQILDRIVSRAPGGAWVLFPLPKQSEWRDKLDVRFIAAFSYGEEASKVRDVSCQPYGGNSP